jgi:hypothetical protein
MRHCDCHPLVTGALAGLVKDFLPARGNFDAWEVHPAGGRQLSLANLDLTQRRNHILQAALKSLPEVRRQFLSILAILSESVDTATMLALNPELPKEPVFVPQPTNPEERDSWKTMLRGDRAKVKAEYQASLQSRKMYEDAVAAWHLGVRRAQQNLSETVHDLEHRGLLQYDPQSQRYDLHPVVRSIAAGGLHDAQRVGYGQRVVDHFSAKVHSPYDRAETVEDVRDGVQIVRTYVKMERYDEAYSAYRDDLEDALLDNLEAYAEVLSLLRPFFPGGWGTLPPKLSPQRGSYLANSAAIALEKIDEPAASLAAHSASLAEDLRANVYHSEAL